MILAGANGFAGILYMMEGATQVQNNLALGSTAANAYVQWGAQLQVGTA